MPTKQNGTLNHDIVREADIRDLGDAELDTVNGGLWPAALAVGIAFAAVAYAVGHK